MNKGIIAYRLIDRLVRKKGIAPIKEDIAPCWKKSPESREIEALPGWEIYEDAFDYWDAGITFSWGFSLVVEKDEKPDAIAWLKYGITVSEPDDDPEFHPALTVEFRHSTSTWMLVFKSGGVSWDYPENHPALLARRFGLTNGDPDSGDGERTERTLTEAEARIIVTCLAEHAKATHAT